MLEVVRHRLPLLIARLLAVVAALLVAGASPAMADPAGPSDFRSEVTGIVPAADGVEAEVRGGDAFLEVRVDEGHEVLVEGYSGEPYLRFSADGTVERNRRSPATYVNDSRKGKGDGPARGHGRRRAGVGGGRDGRHLRVARPPDPLDAGRPPERGPRLEGRGGLRPVAGPDRGRRHLGHDRGDARLRVHHVTDPLGRARAGRRGCARVAGSGTGDGGRAGGPRGRVRARAGGRPGRLRVHPRRRQPAALGAARGRAGRRGRRPGPGAAPLRAGRHPRLRRLRSPAGPSSASTS